MPHSMNQSRWASPEGSTSSVNESMEGAMGCDVPYLQASVAGQSSSRTLVVRNTHHNAFIPWSLWESKWAHGPRPTASAGSATPSEEQPTTSTTELDDPQPDKRICPICQDLIEDPVATPCCHVFCSKHLRAWLEYKDYCPACEKSCSHDEVFGQVDGVDRGPQQNNRRHCCGGRRERRRQAHNDERQLKTLPYQGDQLPPHPALHQRIFARQRMPIPPDPPVNTTTDMVCQRQIQQLNMEVEDIQRELDRCGGYGFFPWLSFGGKVDHSLERCSRLAARLEECEREIHMILLAQFPCYVAETVPGQGGWTS